MRLLKKRWHSIPVALVAVLLALVLATGGALAAYSFMTATVEVTVVEAIAVGIWNPEATDSSGWDNLKPYGSVDDVEITLDGTEAAPVLTIKTLGSGKYVGDGFTANEWIVIPVNIRNGGDGELALGASVTGGQTSGIALEYIWQENTGPATTTESGQKMCRGFVASGSWASLDGWTGTIAGNGGKSGSAVVGAQVLFVLVSVPGDVVPGTYTFWVTLSRS